MQSCLDEIASPEASPTLTLTLTLTLTRNRTITLILTLLSEGSLRQYLKHGCVAAVFGNTLFVHGAVDRQTMGVPPNPNPNPNPNPFLGRLCATGVHPF